ncbi:MAG: enoyl-CoA hydratase/isomerase family protein [Acidimicrobiia bacterium]|nr:enoyl-CoA hydratase/isomerase family protein [Acidimicrobiia bacterium]
MQETADRELLVERREGVSWVTINRPEAGNALSPDVRDDLTAFFRSVSADLHTRVVVLGANGKSFCTGADLRRRKGLETEDRPAGAPPKSMGDAARAVSSGWQQLVMAILDCEKPVIASVQGTAAGGGAQLVLACDLVLMAEGARFIEVFVRRGIIPDAGGAYLLPRVVGLHKAKEIMFFGDDLPAEEAARLGIVNRVVPPGELPKVTEEWALRLAAAPTKAVGMIKALLNRSLESDRTTALRDEAWAQEAVNGTADASEGMRSFAERRDPEFHGW